MEPKTNEELIEVTAKRIYEVMPYDLPGIKPEWVEGGNSLMQSIARGCASGILTTLLTEKDKQREEAVAEALKDVNEREKYVPRFKGINIFSEKEVEGAGCYTSEKGTAFILEENRGEEPTFTPVKEIIYDWYTPPTK